MKKLLFLIAATALLASIVYVNIRKSHHGVQSFVGPQTYGEYLNSIADEVNSL